MLAVLYPDVPAVRFSSEPLEKDLEAVPGKLTH